MDQIRFHSKPQSKHRNRMKKQCSGNLQWLRRLGLALLLTSGLAVVGQTPLTQGHVDVGLAYDEGENEWELHVHDEATDAEYFPATDALLFVKYEAYGTVPAGAQWSFLGAAGSEVWTLPKVENPELLYLGLGTEEIPAGIFAGNSLQFQLKSVTGPGHFALYDVDAFGDPTVLFNSRDGIDAADIITLPVDSHLHYNWAFSAAGLYTIEFEAFGESVVNGPTTSGDVAYLFEVQAVPEPGTGALVLVGALAMGLFRRAARKS
jgi:surface-anchored protein